MSRLVVVLALAALLIPNAVLARGHGHRKPHAVAFFYPVAGSGVSGDVRLRQSKHGGAAGTNIQVVAHGLQPGGHYLSIDYSNAICDLEPDSLQNDVVGRYDGDANGNGTTSGHAGDPLRDIHSVSVRLDDGSADPPLLACATL